MFPGQLGHSTLKIVNFLKVKQAFLQNRSFASKDGWDHLLGPLLDVLEPLEGARKSEYTDMAPTDATADPKNLIKSVGGKMRRRWSQSVLLKDDFFFFESRWLAMAASERKRGDVDCAA